MKLLTALELSFTAGPFFSNSNIYLFDPNNPNYNLPSSKYYCLIISIPFMILSILLRIISSAFSEDSLSF